MNTHAGTSVLRAQGGVGEGSAVNRPAGVVAHELVERGAARCTLADSASAAKRRGGGAAQGGAAAVVLATEGPAGLELAWGWGPG